MNNSPRLRAGNWIPYTWSFLFWFMAVLFVYFLFANLDSIHNPAIGYFQLLFLLVMDLALPFVINDLVVEIAKEGDSLVFRSFGRLPFVPYGPMVREIRVPIVSEFEWYRPYLGVKTPESIELKFKLAIPIRKKTLIHWFNENGLPPLKNV